ncbi:type IV pilin protein [Clostridium hydrogeniformans]|uniref:type IV pilin protein n=1 Tax=Clostridium hydrogeniformans TaxID=349933 RepID=UPI00068BF137|nr:type II secretion system protein [Clostridium hydrogeniformans]
MEYLKIKKKKGFTLVELLAVMGILAILAAILVPSVNSYIVRSRKTAIIVQAREVVNAIEIYNLTSTSAIKIGVNSDPKVSDLPSNIKEYIGEDGSDKIKEAKLSEVYTIYKNVKGDIIDRIELGDNNTFKSLKDK